MDIPFLGFFQVFLDVVESVNILVNSNGQIIRSDVVGALKMRTYLRCVILVLVSSRDNSYYFYST